jgi:hypothetical protein
LENTTSSQEPLTGTPLRLALDTVDACHAALAAADTLDEKARVVAELAKARDLLERCATAEAARRKGLDERNARRRLAPDQAAAERERVSKRMKQFREVHGPRGSKASAVAWIVKVEGLPAGRVRSYLREA